MEVAEENLNEALGQLLMEEEQGKGNIVEYCPNRRFQKFNDEIASSPLKVVYRAYDAEQGREVLWHSIKVRGIPRKELARIRQELFLMKSFDHDHILACIDFWVQLERREIVFVTEITNGGCLRSYLDKIKTTKLKVLKSWCEQILKGLAYLHEQEKPVVHQSIRCDNIYINSTSNDLKLGEIGVLGSTLDPFQPLTGSYQWVAPETSQNNPRTSSDIYSFGMTLLQIVTGNKPYYQCKSQAEIYKLISRNIKPRALKNIPYQQLKHIIEICISPNPDNRPTARQLLQHSFWKANEEIDNNSLKLIMEESKQPKAGKKRSKSQKSKVKSEKQVKLSENVTKRESSYEVKFLFEFGGKKKFEIRVEKEQDEQFQEYISFLTKRFEDKAQSKESTNIFLPSFNHKFEEKEINKDDNTHFLSYGNPTMKTMRLDYLYESRVREDDHKKSITNLSECNEGQADILPKIQEMFLGMYEMYRNKLQSWIIEEPYQEARFLLEKKELEQLQFLEKERIAGRRRGEKSGNVAFLANSINFIDFLNNSEAIWPNQVYNDQIDKDMIQKYPITKFQDALSLNFSSIHNNKEEKQADFDIQNARDVLEDNQPPSNEAEEEGQKKLNESFIDDEEMGREPTPNDLFQLNQQILRLPLDSHQKERQRQKQRERQRDCKDPKDPKDPKETQKRESRKPMFQEQQNRLHKLLFQKKPSITKQTRFEGEFQQPSTKDNLI